MSKEIGNDVREPRTIEAFLSLMIEKAALIASERSDDRAAGQDIAVRVTEALFVDMATRIVALEAGAR